MDNWAPLEIRKLTRCDCKWFCNNKRCTSFKGEVTSHLVVRCIQMCHLHECSQIIINIPDFLCSITRAALIMVHWILYWFLNKIFFAHIGLMWIYSFVHFSFNGDLISKVGFTIMLSILFDDAVYLIFSKKIWKIQICYCKLLLFNLYS